MRPTSSPCRRRCSALCSTTSADRCVRPFHLSKEPSLERVFPFFYSRIRSRRCVGTPTRPRRNTCGSCSCRPRSSASSLSCALISARGCTRHILLPTSSERPIGLIMGIDPQIEKFARYIAATPEVQEKLSQTELDHAKRCAFPFPF